MAETIFRYEFDPTAESKDNLVIGEFKTITYGRDYGIVVLNHAPFYRDGFVLRSFLTSQVLVEGEHYSLIGLNKEISKKTGHAAYDGILFFASKRSEIGDEVLVNYQTVGGIYTHSFDDFESIYQRLMNDTRKVEFNNISDRPGEFKPSPHYHTLHDLNGFSPFVTAIERLHALIDTVRIPEIANLEEFGFKLLNPITDFAYQFKTMISDAINNDIPIKEAYYNSKLSQLRTDFTNVIAQNVNYISTREAEVHDDIDALDVAMRSEIVAIINSFETIFSDVSSNTSNEAMLNTISSYVNSVHSKIGAAMARLGSYANTKETEYRSALQTDLSGKRSEINEKIEEARVTQEDIWQDIKENSAYHVYLEGPTTVTGPVVYTIKNPITANIEVLPDEGLPSPDYYGLRGRAKHGEVLVQDGKVYYTPYTTPTLDDTIILYAYDEYNIVSSYPIKGQAGNNPVLKPSVEAVYLKMATDGDYITVKVSDYQAYSSIDYDHTEINITGSNFDNSFTMNETIIVNKSVDVVAAIKRPDYNIPIQVRARHHGTDGYVSDWSDVYNYTLPEYTPTNVQTTYVPPPVSYSDDTIIDNFFGVTGNGSNLVTVSSPASPSEPVRIHSYDINVSGDMMYQGYDDITSEVDTGASGRILSVKMDQSGLKLFLMKDNELLYYTRSGLTDTNWTLQTRFTPQGDEANPVVGNGWSYTAWDISSDGNRIWIYTKRSGVLTIDTNTGTHTFSSALRNYISFYNQTFYGACDSTGTRFVVLSNFGDLSVYRLNNGNIVRDLFDSNYGSSPSLTCYSVAMSGDGSSIAYFNQLDSRYKIWTKDATESWNLTTQLNAAGAGYIGRKIAINSDGKRIVSSDPYYSSNLGGLTLNVDRLGWVQWWYYNSHQGFKIGERGLYISPDGEVVLASVQPKTAIEGGSVIILPGYRS